MRGQAVIFDIGGVLARISRTWAEAASHAGVPSAVGPIELFDFPPFNSYQASQLPLSEFLSALAALVDCSVDDARRVLDAIPIEPYPGTEALVARLRKSRVKTGCLSNTNEPHWDVFLKSGRFPAIEALDFPAASHLLGVGKPDEAAFKCYEKLFGLKPNQIVYFDDYTFNVEAAGRCGWRAFHVLPDQDPSAQMSAVLESVGLLRAAA